MTNNRFLPRNDGRKKLWKSIHRNMVKRLISHGYPSPKLSRQWDEFIECAAEEYQKYSEYEEEHQNKMRILADEQQRRRVEMAQEMARKRDEWAEQNRMFMNCISSLNSELSHWEKNMALKVSQRIKNYGHDRLPIESGYRRFYEEIIVRYALITDDNKIPSTPLSEEIKNWDKTKLNGWENDFCKSIIIRAILDRELTPKQTAIIEKIRNRLA